MMSILKAINLLEVDRGILTRWLWPIFWLLAVPMIYLYEQTAFYRLDFELLLALLVIPFISRYQKGTTSNRYAWLGLGLAVLFFSGQVSNTLIYLVCCCAMLFWVEQYLGRLNWLIPVLLLLIAPATRYLQKILSFPLRIALSEKAAQVLSLLDETARAEGNIIWYMGTDYSVDAACAGLKLLTASWVIALTWLAYWERKQMRNKNVFTVVFWIFAGTVLAIGANFSRLLFLVLFDISPTSYLHEFTGIIALFFYVVLPLGFGIYWQNVNRRKKEVLQADAPQPQPIIRWHFFPKLNFLFYHVIIPICFLGIMVLGGQYTQNENRVAKAKPAQLIQLAGYEMKVMQDGVLRYTNDRTLIYIKPPVYGWQAAHDPRICWLGEGYQFDQVRKVHIGNAQMMIGRISKEKEQLYTAWWYDTGSNKTIDEWSWRWGSLFRGVPATLYNVSCENEKQLYCPTIILYYSMLASFQENQSFSIYLD